MKSVVGIILCILIICVSGNIHPTNAALNLDVVHVALDGGCARAKTIMVTDEEYEILCRIVEAEATGGNVEQKMNVASCVIARMESKSWPNTIEGVVFQKQQFTPIWDGRYYTVKITGTTKQAVDKVLKNGKTHNCMWFCSDKSYKKKNEQGVYISYHRLNHEWAFYDGEHHYFY